MNYDRRTEPGTCQNGVGPLLRCYMGRGASLSLKSTANQRRRWRRYGKKLLPLLPLAWLFQERL
jgi:hypothetical protein